MNADDEREALTDELSASVAWMKRTGNFVDADRVMRAIAYIRNRHRFPIAKDEREALVKGFADVIFAAGLRSPESTKAVIAFKESLDGWHNSHRGPITEDMVDAAAWAIAKDDDAFGDTYNIDDYRNMARDALEAAKTHRA